ncbi:hypothetical protein PC116_g17135 [Phytophthora cactorum]|nr:hypothetical protein Pcac1_g10120 [Phytophthora cactorum]KAG4234710.1 hypothetical protein PC116_g17135 [Phytophthora cactorum]
MILVDDVLVLKTKDKFPVLKIKYLSHWPKLRPMGAMRPCRMMKLSI